MKQTSFLDEPKTLDQQAASHRTDPSTSQEAAVENAVAINGQRLLVHNVVLLNPDKTAAELAAIYCERSGNEDIGDWQVKFTRRLSELNKAGVVQVVGKRRCAIKGSNMRTWKAIREVTGAQIR